jgi:hypothetical protein
MKTKFAIALLSTSLLLSACSKSEEAAPAAPEATTAATPAATPAVASATGSGVPECDAYLDKVMACIKDKVPEAQRAAFEQGIEANKASWASVTDKAKLAQTCTSAMEQAKTSMGAMGCTF